MPSPVQFAITLFLLLSVQAISHAKDWREIKRDDPAGEPYKEAARVLLRAIANNDEAAARDAFVGTGKDLDLLVATLATNRATTDFRDAALEKFDDPRVRTASSPAEQMLRSVDRQSILVDENRPDKASISPASFPSNGYEVILVREKWVVASITSVPKRMDALLDVHSKLQNAYRILTTRVKAGEFHKIEDLFAAGAAAITTIMDEYEKQVSPR